MVNVQAGIFLDMVNINVAGPDGNAIIQEITTGRTRKFGPSIRGSSFWLNIPAVRSFRKTILSHEPAVHVLEMTGRTSCTFLR